VNPEERFDKIQIYPTETNGAGHALWRELRQLVGKRVSVVERVISKLVRHYQISTGKKRWADNWHSC
jgi:hypothetical protein